MGYLAEWRMREAADMRATSGASVATILENVGYESEVALRRRSEGASARLRVSCVARSALGTATHAVATSQSNGTQRTE